VQLVPDAPIDLTNVPEVTDATTIKFSWTEAPENGGAAVIDYSVYYD
jgi:hypothetical protein